jgi:hypothetical protein
VADPPADPLSDALENGADTDDNRTRIADQSLALAISKYLK